MRNILITGGAGNIGSALAAGLVRDPDTHVVVLDDLSTGFTAKLPAAKHGNLTFVQADANDRSALATVMSSTRFEFVFHYAAVVGVQRTLQHPIRVLRDIDGIRNVLELARESGVRRVFYSSSSEVYGEPVVLPQHEDTTPLNSRLPYAIVKNVGEAYCRSYRREFGLPYTIFRFFNTYGPHQSEDFVIPRFLRAAANGDDLTIYGDGMQTRTFCFIDDNVDATLRALEADRGVDETINIGSDQEITILELARLIKAATRSTSRIVHLPPLPEGDMTRRLPDTTRMRDLLRRVPTPLDEGIRRMVAAMEPRQVIDG